MLPDDERLHYEVKDKAAYEQWRIKTDRNRLKKETRERADATRTVES